MFWDMRYIDDREHILRKYVEGKKEDEYWEEDVYVRINSEFEDWCRYHDLERYATILEEKGMS